MTTKQVKLNTRTITPTLAAKYLKLNTSNRPLSQKHVNVLAGAMERGEWQMTGESIKISDQNTLLDGQHRLSAIVKANVTVKMVVVENLPVEAFHVIDTGAKSRGTADVMAIAGEKNPLVLAAAVRIVANWEIDPDLTKNTTTWSVTQLEEVLSRHPGLRKHSDVRSNLSKMLPSSYACAFSYLFSVVDPKISQNFMERLATGAGLEKGNPILLLRDHLISNKVARSKFSKKVIAALVIKAFNAYQSGKHPGTLRWRVEEKFPAIIDAKIYKAGA